MVFSSFCSSKCVICVVIDSLVSLTFTSVRPRYSVLKPPSATRRAFVVALMCILRAAKVVVVSDAIDWMSVHRYRDVIEQRDVTHLPLLSPYEMHCWLCRQRDNSGAFETQPHPLRKNLKKTHAIHAKHLSNFSLNLHNNPQSHRKPWIIMKLDFYKLPLCTKAMLR